MRKLEAQLMNALQPGMFVPEPFKKLFAWIEDNGYFVDLPTGKRVGFFYPEAKLRAGWADCLRRAGTTLAFVAEGNEDLQFWFGHKRDEVLNRLCVFAKTGADGSVAALWLDPDGCQKIVHLGSGSGSQMVCVLADDGIDFMRLLAIGYDEVCWGRNLAEPPGIDSPIDHLRVLPNEPFQSWVRETFKVQIPSTGAEIVKHPDDLGAPHSSDVFNKWVAASVA